MGPRKYLRQRRRVLEEKANRGPFMKELRSPDLRVTEEGLLEGLTPFSQGTRRDSRDPGTSPVPRVSPTPRTRPFLPSLPCPSLHLPSVTHLPSSFPSYPPPPSVVEDGEGSGDRGYGRRREERRWGGTPVRRRGPRSLLSLRSSG